MKTIGFLTSPRRRTKTFFLCCLGAIALLGCQGSKLPDGEPVAAVSSETNPAQLLEVPIQFQGEWNVDLERCASKRGDTRLVILSDSIRHYASNGPFTEVVVHSDSKITVTAELLESGYPPPFMRTATYQLSEDGLELTELIPDLANNFTRKRCPGE